MIESYIESWLRIGRKEFPPNQSIRYEIEAGHIKHQVQCGPMAARIHASLGAMSGQRSPIHLAGMLTDMYALFLCLSWLSGTSIGAF